MKKMKFNLKRSLIIISLTLILFAIAGFIFQNNWFSKSNFIDEFKDELLENIGSYDEQKIVLQSTNEKDAMNLAERLNAKLRITNDGSFATLTLPDGTTIRDVVNDPNNADIVDKFSIDYQATISELDEIEEKYVAIPSKVIPSDNLYEYQSYLDYLHLGNVWENTKGSGITVAVIDTGIDTDHPEFVGKISEYSYNATTDKIVKDTQKNDGSYDWSIIEDKVGHGTAVTGVIAAPWENGGIAGIAPDVEIITIKAECNSDGSFLRTSDLVFGLYYAIERDVDLVNMSFGGYGSNPYADAALLAVDSDIVLVAAAGNDATAALSYPAADPNVIGVGALAADSFELASYSNFGENTDVVAPGTVYTTKMNGEYGYINGTSFASPVAVGVLALQLSYDKYYRGLWYQEVSNVEEVLYASSTDLGDLGHDWYYGYGVIDATDLILSERKEIIFNYLTDEIDNTKQVFIKNKPLQNIPEPERNYAVFDGWYYDIYCTDEYNLYADSWSTNLTMYCNWANEDDSVPYTYVELDDGTIEIRSYTGKRRYITVPEYIDGKVVSSIGVEAFQNQSRLRIVNLPKQLKYIRSNAFANCSNLTSINIPDTVTVIDVGAFQNAVRLFNVNFTADSKLERIGQYAFKNCSNLSRIDLPVGVNSITGNSFLGCISLKQINADRNSKVLNSVDGVLFNKSRTNLIVYPAGKASEQYVVPTAVNNLGESAFAFSKIKEIDLKNVTNIDANCFAYSNIRKVDLGDSVTYLGAYAFSYSKITNIQLGHGLTSIEKNTFEFTELLYSIEIPNTIQTINSEAFLNSSVNTVTFEENSSLILFNKSSFKYSCITSLNLPDSVVHIGAEAFMYTPLLKLSISDKSALTQIGDNAFFATWITEVNLPQNLQYLGQYSFAYTLLKEVTIPASVNDFQPGVFAACSELQNIFIDEENKDYTDVDGVAYTKNLKKLHEYPSGRKDASYTILDGVEVIQSCSFFGSYNLNNVNYPNTVITIGEYAFYDCVKIIYHELPSSLESIERYAFSQNISLGNISIPKKVTKISNHAFSGNYNMNYVYFDSNAEIDRLSFAAFAECGIYSIEIPANVSTIAQEVFIGCPNLHTISFARNSKIESISAYMFKGCDNLQTIRFKNGSALTSVQAHAFEGMSNLYSVDFGDAKITNIDNYAFRYCESLQEINIPSGVEYIGRYAFYDCKSLSSIVIPESVEFIGRYAFYLTNNINIYFQSSILPLGVQENWDYGINGYYVGVQETYVDGNYELAKLYNGTIGIIKYNGTESVVDLTKLNVGIITQIGGYSFEGTCIEKVILPNTLKAIDRNAFANSSIKDIVIPSSVEQIGDYAFSNSSLSTITFDGNSNLQKIGMYAFSETKELKNVILPKSLKYLGSYAFLHSALESVTFEDGIQLTEFKEGTFQATNLVTVKIPSSITLIDHSVFRDNTKLQKVDFGTARLQIMANVFYNSGLKEVYIPETVEYIGEYSFVGLKNLSEFVVDENNPYYTSKDGVLYSKDYKKLIAFPGNKTGSFKIPNTVEVIGFGAFENSKLTKVDFEQGINLLTFGYRAFYNSLSLQEINIPESVVSIDYYAFAMCQSLETVIFAQNSKLTGIYEGAFYGCTNLRNITIPDEIYEISDYAFSGCLSLSRLPISENSKLMGIYKHAFENTAITELKLPSSLIDIGSYAFKGLKVEKLEISSSNKEQLIIGLGAFAECNEIEEITIPFVGASLDDDILSWFGYIFGAGNASANATYVPSSLKIVNIGEGQTIIYNNAFAGLNNIEVINLPSSLEELKNNVFENCSKIKDIYLGENLKIVSGAFTNCENLENIYFAGSIGDWVKIDSESDSLMYAEHLYLLDDKGDWYEPSTIVIPNGVEIIGNYAFYNLETITSIEIPNTVTEIRNEAFWNCFNLKDVYFKGTLDEWLNINFYSYGSYPNNYAINFYLLDEDGNWYKPTTYKIPDGTPDINPYQFVNFTELKSIEIPLSVTLIGEGAFGNCYNLENVYYYGTLEDWINIEFFDTWGSSPLNYAMHFFMLDDKGEWYEPTEIEIVDGTKIIKRESYQGISSLRDVYIPKSVVKIESEAFSNCVGLENVYYYGTLEDWSLITFEDYASNPMTYASHFFMLDEKGEWYEPTSVVVKEGRTEIKKYEYYRMSSIVSIEIPSSVVKFSEYSLDGLVNLENIYYHGSVEEWFAITKYSYLMNIVKHLYLLDENNNWYEPTKLVIPEGDYNVSSSIINDFPKVNHLVIPGFYKKINAWTFNNNQKLETVEFETGIEEIGEYAFAWNSAIKNLYLPNTLNKIEYGAFVDCENIENVYYRGSIDEWLNVEFVSYYSNPALYAEHFYVLNENNEWYEPTYVKITEGTKELNSYSLLGLSAMVSVEIPSSVTKFGSNVFDNCYNLTNVYYHGTLEEWLDIEKLSNTFGYASNFFMLDENNNWHKPTKIVLPEGLETIDNSVYGFLSDVKHIVVPGSYKIINRSAFASSANLETIEFKTGVEEIGVQALAWSYNITTVYLPNTIKKIYNEAFTLDGNLQTIYYDGTFEEWNEIEFVGYNSNPLSNGAKIYLMNNGKYEELTDLVIPSNYETVNSNLVYNFNTVSKLVIPETVKTIEDSAFSNFYSLRTIEIKPGVETIKANAFINSTLLDSIYYYGTPEQWMNITFESSSSNPLIYAKHLYFLNENNEWYELTDLVVPENITTIKANVFENLSTLKTIKTHKNITTIESHAFYNCSNLREVYLYDGISEMSYQAFESTNSLESVYFYGTTSKWFSIYFVANGLRISNETRIYFPDENNKWIEPSVVELPNNIDYVSSDQFINFRNLEQLILPASIKTIVGVINVNSNPIKNIYYKGSFDQWVSIDFGWYCNPVDYAEHVYMLDENDNWYEPTSFVISENINQISSFAFYGNENIKDIELPLSITQIGLEAFYNCINLENVYYHGTIDDWMSIEFVGSSSNPMHHATHFYMLDENGNWYEPETIVVSDKHTVIKSYTLSNFKSMKNIEIPSTVITIENEVFAGCDSLENVYYHGTIDDWMNINMNGWGSTPMNFAKHFYLLDDNDNWYEPTEIVISEDHQVINEYRFASFAALQNIVLPNSLQQICNTAFDRCEQLQNVYYKGTLEDWMNINFDASPMSYAEHFYLLDENNNWYEPTKININEGITELRQFVFYNVKSINEVKLPSTLKTIQYASLEGCDNIENIYYYGTIEQWFNIEKQSSLAYKNLYVLDENNQWYEPTEVIIPDNISTIKTNMLSNLALSKLTIPASVKIIECNNFDTNNLIDEIYYNGTILDWLEVALSGWDSNPMYFTNKFYMLDENGEWYLPTEVIIPEGTVSLSSAIFAGNNSIKTIYLPNSIKEIDYQAFYNCQNLEKVYYNGTIEEWMNIDFKEWTSNPVYYARNLYVLDDNGSWYLPTEINIPEGTVSIKPNVFSGMNSLIKITLPSSLASIGYNAFEQCYNIFEVINNSSLDLIPGIWESNQGYISAYAYIVNNRGEITYRLDDVTNDNCKYIETDDGFVFLQYGTSYYLMSYKGEQERPVLPFLINDVHYSCRYIDGTLKNIELSSDFTYVPYCMFENTSVLETIILPDTITSISYGAFSKCSNLKDIIFKEGLISIENNSFESCDSLTSIVIPGSVAYIGDFAFFDCNNLKAVINNSNILLVKGSKDNGYVAYYADNVINLSTSNTFAYGDFIYTVINGTYYLLSYTGNDECVELPKTINGATYLCKYMDSTLKNVKLAEDLEFINYEMFEYCVSLESIIIPKSVKHIYSEAFNECSNLKEVYYEGTISDWVSIEFNYSNLLYYADRLFVLDKNNNWYEPVNVVIEEGITYINAYSFYSYKKLESIELPASLKFIGNEAFYDCTSLSKVYFNGNIDDWAKIYGESWSSRPNVYASQFYLRNGDSWEAVKSISLSEEIEIIDRYTFAGFEQLETIYLPSTITEISDGAFERCNNLENVYFNGTIEQWQNISFYTWSNSSNPVNYATNFYVHDENNNWYKPTEFTVKEGITDLYYYVNINSLEKVILPSTLQRISSGNFEKCVNLTEVYYNGTIEDWINISIDSWNNNPMACTSNFYLLDENGNYYKLVDLIIPEGVTEITYGKFSCAKFIENVYLPQSLESIKNDAFYECSNINNVYYYGTLETWGNIEFNWNSNPTQYANNFYILDENNNWVKPEDLVISAGTKVIGPHQFYNIQSLTSIEIPSSVISIGECAFDMCENLTSVYYHGTLEDWVAIDKKSDPMTYANHFYMLNDNNEWYEITDLKIPEGVTEIKYNEYEGFELISSVTIPEGVTKIGGYAFGSCINLTKVELPSSIEYIEYGAFYNCQNLLDVYYHGTFEEWLNINFYDFDSNPLYSGQHLYMLDENGEWYEVKNFVIPESITSIKQYALLGFENLEAITIHGNIDSIYYNAFEYCHGLTKIYFDGTVEELLSMDNDLYYSSSWSFVSDIYMLDENNNWHKPTTLTIPEGMSIIDSIWIKYLKELKTVIIPQTVKEFGNETFSACQYLTNVYYNGSIYDWFDIEFKSDFSNPMKTAKYFYFNDGNNNWIELTEFTVRGDEKYNLTGFSSIERITINEGATTIDEYAFAGLTKLNTIYLPASLEKIGNYAFSDCTSLENVYYSGSVKEWISLIANSNFEYTNPLEFAKNFYVLDENNEWEKVTELIVPGTVENVYQKILKGFESVETVVFEEGVKQLGSNTLCEFKNIKNLYIPSSIEYIGPYIFNDSTMIQNVYYYGSILDWLNINSDEWQFANPAKYTHNFYMYNNGEWEKVKDITIPNSIDYLDSNKLTHFVDLETIRFEEGITNINYFAISYLTKLTSIYLPKSLKSIETNAIYDCEKLQNVYYYGTIEEWANINFVSMESNPMCYAEKFYVLNESNEWKLLTEVRLGDNVTSINSYAFYNFDSITSVYISKNIEYVGNAAFYSCDNLMNIYYTGETKDWFEIDFVNEDSDPCVYASNFYVLDENNNWVKPTKLEIVGDITTVYVNTFKAFKDVEEVDIKTDVTEIYEGFRGFNNLKSIYLPSSLKYASYIVIECENLENVYFYGTLDDWALINFNGWNPVYHADHFYVKDINGNWYEPTKYVLSDNVKEINEGAFKSHKLTCIELPKSIVKINNDAFEDTSPLENVYYHGTMEDWMNIEFVNMYSNPMVYAEHLFLKDENGNWFEPTELKIAEGTITLKRGIFRSFSLLKDVELPKSICSIESEVFSNCTELENVYYHGTIEEWMNIEFESYDSNPMYYAKHFYILNENNEWYEPQIIKIKEGVSEIKDVQFMNFTSLISLELPSTISKIGYDAFGNCINLNSAYYHGTYNDWMNINKENNSLSYVEHLYMLDENGDFVEPSEIVIPEGVTELNEQLFPNINTVNKIVLPSTLVNFSYIGIEYDSTYTIKEIYYNGTIFDWFNVNIYSWNYNPMKYSEHFYMLDENGNWYEPTDFVVPDGISTINYSQFACSPNIKNIEIPRSVTRIASEAFYECHNLENVYYYGTLEEWVNIAFDSWCSNPMEYAQNFYVKDENGNWYEPTEYVIPEGITEIKPYSFKGLKGLRKITIPSTIINIGTDSFIGCDNLIEIINNSTYDFIPGDWDWYKGYVSSNALIVNNRGVTTYREDYINDSNCKYLETKDGLVFLQYGDIYYLISYNGTEDIPVLPYQINGHNYNCRYMDSTLKEVELSSEFEYIPSNMFDSSRTLEKVILPNTIQYIYWGAFANCSKLKYINLPESIINIDGYAFANCRSLTSIELPNKLETINYGLFENCTNLTEIVIPNSVNAINSYAFANCTKLSDIVLPISIEYVGEFAFHNTAYWNNQSNWHDGNLYIQNVLIKADSSLVEYYLPEEITCIASYAFENCYSLRLVEVTGNSQRIFNNCSNIETLVIKNMPENSIMYYFGYSYYDIPITLQKIIIKNECVVKHGYHFEGISGVKVFVDEYELNVQWDHDYPNWENNNEVYYKGEWINVKFYDYDDSILYDDYLSVYEMIRQPIIKNYISEGKVYNFVGWDINNDGIIDDYPAMSNIDLVAKAIYTDSPYKYTVTYYDIDGFTVLHQEEYSYGDTLRLINGPMKIGYEFIRWTNYPSNLVVEKDISIYSEWKHIGGGHVYEKTIVPATCAHEGYTHYRCSICMHEYTDDYISTLEHKYDKWVEDKQATCIEEGYKHHTCTECGYIEYADIEKAEHHYDTEVISKATCTNNGEVTHTCKICGDEFHEFTNVIDHKYKKKVVKKSIFELIIRYLLNMFYGIENNNYFYYQCESCNHILLNNESLTGTKVNSVCDHINTEWETILDETCNNEGYQIYKCHDCDKVLESKTVPQKEEHDYEVQVFKATCEKDGYTLYTCECGHSYQDNFVPAFGHKYSEPMCNFDGTHMIYCENNCGTSNTFDCIYNETIVKPTCEKDGYTIYSCECGHTYNGNYKDALGHNYKNWTILKEATENEAGLKESICENCGEKTSVIIPILSHIHNYKSVIVDPTCTEKGYTSHTCSCGDTYMDSYINALGHAYGDWVIVKEATENEPGLKEKTCTHCKDVVSQVIPVLVHTHKYESVIVDPTCTEKGYTMYTCKCGDIYKDTYVNATGHAYGSWIVVKEATEKETGLKEKTCSNCDHVISEVIPVGTHVHQYETKVVEPTCTEKGYSVHTCTCGASFKDSYVNATGHSYGEWVIIVNPTCTNKGYEEHECNICGTKEQRNISTTPHNYKEIVVEPTCEERGYTVFKCKDCSHTYTGDYTSALGHQYGNWEVIIEPTCTELGTKIKPCIRCDHNMIGSISKIDHVESDWIIDKEATSKEEGRKHKECINCHEILEVETIEKVQSSKKGCKKSAGYQFVSISSAFALAVLILRKKR